MFKFEESTNSKLNTLAHTYTKYCWHAPESSPIDSSEAHDSESLTNMSAPLALDGDHTHRDCTSSVTRCRHCMDDNVTI